MAGLIRQNELWAKRCARVKQEPTAMLYLRNWFNRPNPEFKNRTPREMLREHDVEPLLLLLEQLD